jgi:hypothetical protein
VHALPADPQVARDLSPQDPDARANYVEALSLRGLGDRQGGGLFNSAQPCDDLEYASPRS